MIRKLLYFLYVAVVIVMAAATFIEHADGTAHAHQYIYGAWWFTFLWAVLAAVAVIWLIRRRVRQWFVVLLHLSMLIILVGALLTHLDASQGVVHLRQDKPTSSYMKTASDGSQHPTSLPFLIQLHDFQVSYHEGTHAAADYQSLFTITDGTDTVEGSVSMNHIFSYRGYRFYQSSYDDDLHGSTLSVNVDPWGIAVTYLGYALLFFSLLLMLIHPKGTYRRLLKHPALRRGTLATALLLTLNPQPLNAQTTLSPESAEQFGRMLVLYNDRICPLETYALDFTKKLCGHRSYNGFTACQVLAGFIFWGDEWTAEPVIKMKGGELRSQLYSDDYRSFDSFFRGGATGYVLAPYIEAYYKGSKKSVDKQAAEMDEKLGLVVDLRRGVTFKIFPIVQDVNIHWLSTTDESATKADSVSRAFMESAVTLMYRYALSGNDTAFRGVVNDVRKYQYRHGGNSLPQPSAIRAEKLYNKVPFATILFMGNLTLGFLTLFWFMARLARGHQPRHARVVENGFCLLLIISFAALSLCLALRWIICGSVPMSNGYETMLLTAWLIMLVSLLTYRRTHLVLTFGFLLSGFFLLVSHINQMDPQIGRLMPVLNSPLLSIHVGIIMMAYALLSMTFICGVMAMILYLTTGDTGRRLEQQEALMVLSQLFLHPAITCLGLGIFIGAIWANVSWGQYWSWDPKETWALITFMVYAVSLHHGTVPVMRRPFWYHLYQLLAFLTLLMTYFGVNYLLGGMHSYA